MRNIQDITVDQIERVYNGKAGACCCGCAGTYSETPASKKRLLNKMKASPEAVGWIDDNIAYMDNETGTRTHTLYLNA